jgi:hypothetical protein
MTTSGTAYVIAHESEKNGVSQLQDACFAIDKRQHYQTT